VLTTLFWAWWPQPGTYRPIDPNEKGLLTAVLPSAQHVARVNPAAARPGLLPVGASAERRLADGEAPLQATFQRGKALPTKAHPKLAIVLVPTGSTDGQPPAEPWVFPFDKPLPPEKGDNQAAAFNTTDNSTKYDVAFALVWAEGDEVLNVNEAHAYASCSDCVTVAVAFQVVLIMDDAHVVVPQNLAVAANYQCYKCITAAIASQLVLSVEKTPGHKQLLALGDVWARLTQFGHDITAYSLAQISAQLDEFKAEIVAILDDAPPAPAGGTSTSPTPSATPTGTPSTGSSEPSPTSATPTSPPTGTTSSSSPTGTTSTDASPAAPTSDPPPATSPAPSSPAPSSGTATGSPAPSP
jgi:putative peptide zinc metalloprotease protein